jgi:hypothetical protein
VNPDDLTDEERADLDWIRDQMRELASHRAQSMTTAEINAELKAWRKRSAEIRVELERLRGRR